jgi:hypothetical protein
LSPSVTRRIQESNKVERMGNVTKVIAGIVSVGAFRGALNPQVSSKDQC